MPLRADTGSRRNRNSAAESETVSETFLLDYRETSMRKNTRGCPLAAVGCTLAALSASPAWAEETDCSGRIGARTVDNLRVPENTTCRLIKTRVKGTVKVETNATLVARNILVVGNVQAENARQIRVLEGSHVGGSVQVKQGGGGTVSDSRVDGDVQYEANSTRVRALRNNVGGNIQAVQNFGGVVIRRNVVDGNLQCKENFPAPIGGGNTVSGNKEDQCTGF